MRVKSHDEITAVWRQRGFRTDEAPVHHQQHSIKRKSKVISRAVFLFFFCSGRSEAYSPAAGELLSVILLLVTPCHRSARCARTPASAPAPV